MQIQHVGQQETVEGQDLPFLVLRRSFFSMMFDTLIKNYGSAGVSMIFTMGRDRGVGEVKDYRSGFSEFSLPLTKMELLNKVLIRLNYMGWGKLKIEEYDQTKGVLRINVKLNPFVDKCRAEINGGCIFLQGLLTGIVSEAFEKDVSMSDPRSLESPESSCELNVVSSNPMMN